MSANGSPAAKPDYRFDPGKILASTALTKLTLLEGRWVCWRYEWRHGRWTKPPCLVSGRPADSTDPRTWADFDECAKAASSLTARSTVPASS
jgi:hypothetical protein